MALSVIAASFLPQLTVAFFKPSRQGWQHRSRWLDHGVVDTTGKLGIAIDPGEVAAILSSLRDEFVF